MCSVQTLTVGILAGGKGARLGGRDKGMLVFEGEPFVAKLLSSVRRNLVAVPELAWVDTVINCPRNSHFYQHYADRLLCDGQLQAGPSAGIAALLATCTTDWLLTLACDQWQVPATGIEKLFSAASFDTEDHYRWGKPSAGSHATDRGRHTPCLLINTAKVPEFNPRGSLLQLIEVTGLLPVELTGSGTDVDTPADLARLKP